MHENGIAALRQVIRPRAATIVMILVGDHQRMRGGRGAGDFAEAEVLVAAMIMQGDDGGQLAFGADGLEQDRLSGRAVGQLPLQVLDREPSNSN